MSVPPLRIPQDPTFSLARLCWHSQSLPAYLNRPGQWFRSGREALIASLRYHGVPSGAKTLLPEYICDVVPLMLARHGYQCNYYRLSRSLEPDLLHIKAAIEPATRVILVINYFGFPAQLQGIRALASEHGLLLVEDNAQGFLGTYEEKPLGTRADVGIFSLHKSLGLPNGAAFWSRLECTTRPASATAASSPATVCQEARFFLFGIARDLLRSLPRNLQSLIPRQDQQSETPAEPLPVEIYAMGPISRFILRHYDLGREVHARQNCYAGIHALLNTTPRLRQAPLNDQGASLVPLVFPLWVTDAVRAAQVLQSYGVMAYTWPRLPAAIAADSAWRTAHYWHRHLVCLPLHASTGHEPQYLTLLREALARVEATQAQVVPGEGHSREDNP